MSKALKPCPFCGDKMVLTKAETLVHIKQGCCIIGAMGFMSVSAWNTRTDLAATDEQAFANEKVKALVEALRKTVRALGEMTDDDWMGEIDHHAVMLTLHEARVTLAETQDG